MRLGRLVFTNNKQETLPWLELLLQMSGAASTLKRLLNQLENIKNEIETKILPAVERLEEIDRRFTKLSNWHNKRQKDELELRGYTFLSREQSKMMLTGGDNGQSKILQKINEDELGDDENELEEVLEEDIRKLSKINENDPNLTNKVGDEFKKYLIKNRRKRFMEIESLGQMRILDPFLFVNQVNDGKVMRRVALSPRAFSLQLLTPDFGGVIRLKRTGNTGKPVMAQGVSMVNVLSPFAFVPSILSPRAAMLSVLSPNAFTLQLLAPEAFRVEVISPQTFNAKILSPRAFIAYVISPRLVVAEILNPKAFEVRVLTPTIVSFTVLSPAFAQIPIGSPQYCTFTVLTPSILSPGFLSDGGVGNIRVLSPKILSGRTKRKTKY
uniref:Uncharacterized protein n=1 Tax=Meloidogyne floridensis TaxID=298350 RepID=A0A915P9D7_9BILA